jgi:hypothetical protein
MPVLTPRHITLPGTFTGLFPTYSHSSYGVFNGSVILFAPNVKVGSAFTNVNVVPTVTTLSGSKNNLFRDIYYNTIYVIEPKLNVSAPVPGQLYPYYIWNAFFTNKVLSSITTSGSVGLTNSALPVTFTPIQVRRYDISMLSNAPVSINTTYGFNFPGLLVTLNVTMTRAIVINTPMEQPMTQTWTYNTDVQTSWNHTETRIAYTIAPEEEISGEIREITDADTQYLENKFYQRLNTPYLLPQWYDSRTVRSNCLFGSTTLTGDWSQFDIRVNDNVMLEDISQTYYDIMVVLSVTATTITFTSGVQNNYYTGSAYVHRLTAYLQNNGVTIKRYSVNASATNLDLKVVTRKKPLGLGAPAFTLHNSTPVLDVVPVNPDVVPSSIDNKYELVDFTGKKDTFTGNELAEITHTYQFHVEGVDMQQFFTAFQNYCNGRQKTFYMPTYRPNLTLTIPVSGVYSQLNVSPKANYKSLFFPRNSHKQLAIFTQGGVYYRNVVNVTTSVTLDHVIDLESPIPLGTGNDKILMISFLQLCRLGSDVVKYDHYSRQSTCYLTVVTTQA